ncbi:MAG: SDR family oxidoreductase [Paracoccaceae bacterium]|nr:SDR family oxidoreductase [Paracoccaceae bacterium]
MTKIATFHDLKDKSVFITGGGSGIGAAITDGFMEQGAKVTFVQRSPANEFVAEMTAKHGFSPLFIKCDITDVSALQAAMDQASAAHGPIGVLVNNAANDVRHSIDEVDEAFWDNNQSLNLKAYFFAAQKAARDMKSIGGGSIINMTSISYLMGQAGYISYITANSGINGMTRGLAREFGPDKIRANSLAPGWVLTQKQKDMWVTPEALEAHLAKQCLKETLDPQDIKDAVLFLASGTSRMITNQTLVVDGGVVTTG